MRVGAPLIQAETGEGAGNGLLEHDAEHDVAWLLEQLAERDARIAELEAESARVANLGGGRRWPTHHLASNRLSWPATGVWQSHPAVP
jgi:hypothetical protein